MIYTPAITITPASSHIHHHPYTYTITPTPSPLTNAFLKPPLFVTYHFNTPPSPGLAVQVEREAQAAAAALGNLR